LRAILIDKILHELRQIGLAVVDVGDVAASN
jgi:hypothetical protein